MKPSYLVLSLLLLSFMASAAVTASASTNLLQNPGFETGDFPPWEWNKYIQVGDGWAALIDWFVRTGNWAAHIQITGYKGEVWIWQDISPQCAKYLEFWYTYFYQVNSDGFNVTITYSDGTEHLEKLPYVEDWTLVHIDLDTTKLVKTVEVKLWVSEGRVEACVDDFDLEACASPVGGEVISTSFPNLLMAIAVAAVPPTIALGYKLSRKATQTS